MEADVRGTALVVDDSALARLQLVRCLERMGLHVWSAPSAEAALEAMKANPPLDLVLTDMHMDGASGLDLIRTLRERGELAGVPMIVLTATLGPELISAARAARATGWLEKPLDEATLRRVLRRTLPAAT